jgi:hypothetical protein
VYRFLLVLVDTKHQRGNNTTPRYRLHVVNICNIYLLHRGLKYYTTKVSDYITNYYSALNYYTEPPKYYYAPSYITEAPSTILRLPSITLQPTLL